MAKEADLIDEGQKEAIAILDAVKKYCADCPKEWGSNLPESCFLESICVVTPWKKQVQMHIAGVSTCSICWTEHGSSVDKLFNYTTNSPYIVFQEQGGLEMIQWGGI